MEGKKEKGKRRLQRCNTDTDTTGASDALMVKGRFKNKRGWAR